MLFAAASGVIDIEIAENLYPPVQLTRAIVRQNAYAVASRDQRDGLPKHLQASQDTWSLDVRGATRGI